MTGTVFNVQKFCINDGPGIRTTVFLKGCPLSCAWCHNPESQKTASEIMYSPDKCISCGACTRVCRVGAHSVPDKLHLFDRSRCEVCGACADACPAKAVEKAGKQMTVEEILEDVMRDKAFYDNSGGGLTISGGEPFAQFNFTLELLKEAKKLGLHTCVETCGAVSTEKILKAAEFVDVFLYDWKLTDGQLHRKYVGTDNGLIEKNLRALDETGAKTVLRCPIIPCVNDTKEHFEGIAALAESLNNLLRIELEPYHPLGTDKLTRLGRDNSVSQFDTPAPEKVDEWIGFIGGLTEVEVIKA
ncbi:MAG: glycyl-radical enzyme activating protein [Clostridia bacterium]|nr:glycyl-radical enzyme activating protein [Clostridia bacterium]